MRVLHVINNLETGGAEKLLTDSLPYYEEENISVDVLLLLGNSTNFLIELQKKFKGKIMHTKLKSLYNFKQIARIKNRIRNYDIVHVHLFPALYWVAFANFRKKNPILIFTEHSTNNKRMNSFLFKQIDKLIYKKYKAIIAITPQVKRAIISKLQIYPQKIHVIYNGVEVSKYKLADSYNKEDFFQQKNIRLLVQVSRFSEQKDQETVIRSLSLMPSNYCLLFVGEGKTKTKCMELVRELRLNNRVVFLGNRNDVPQLLKTADIVIQSSHWEGFGLAAVEGMASNKPVVVSIVSGLAEVVEGAGILFEKGNIQDLTDKVLSLESLDKYNVTSQKCYERAKVYNLNSMVQKTVSLYRSLL